MGSASAKGGQQGDTFETVRFVAATCRTCDVKKSSTPRNPYAYSNDQHLFLKLQRNIKPDPRRGAAAALLTQLSV